MQITHLILAWGDDFVFLQAQTYEFMTKLSVNINKLATLRNARGGNVPDVLQAARAIESFGAQGITVHPRPDERHIRYNDARALAPIVSTEFNIEGKPIPSFIALVLETKPAQVTLVPDADEALTSNAGWDAIAYEQELKAHISVFKEAGIRTSIFIDPVLAQIEAAQRTGADRIELYTENYAHKYAQGERESAIAAYRAAAQRAHELGLGVNAGHDLSLDNIAYFKQQMPHLDEVSIGHALIAEALYLGLETTVKKYLTALS